MRKNLDIYFFIVFCIAVAIVCAFTAYNFLSPAKPGAAVISSLFALMSIFVCAVAGFIYFKYEKLSIQKIFAIFFILFGLLYAFIIPMFGNNDEPNHWRRILQIKEGHIFADVSAENPSQLGGFLPSNAVPRIRGISDLFIKLDFENRQWNEFSNTAAYFPISYIFQMPGIIAVSLFSKMTFLQAYTGRLSSLFFSFILCLFMIKQIPFKKKTLFALFSTPVFLQQSAALCADISIILTAFLISVFVIICYQDEFKEISKKHLAFFAVLSLSISLVKTVYLPIMLLFLAVPFSKHKKTKNFIVFFAALFIVCMFLDLTWTIGAGAFYTQDNFSRSYVLSHSVYAIYLIARNLIFTIPETIYETFGGAIAFGVSGQSSFSPILAFVYAFYFIVLILCDDFYKPNKLLSAFSAVIIIAVSFAVTAAILIGGDFFKIVFERGYLGMHARYLYPIAFLAVLLISGIYKIHLNIDKEIVFKNFLLLAAFMHLAVFSSVIIFFSKYLLI